MWGCTVVNDLFQALLTRGKSGCVGAVRLFRHGAFVEDLE